MNIKPLHDKVLIKRVDEETKTAGGICHGGFPGRGGMIWRSQTSLIIQ